MWTHLIYVCVNISEYIRCLENAYNPSKMTVDSGFK